jgi:hypothetical protein
MVKSLGRKNLDSVKLAIGAVWAPWHFALTDAQARKKQILCWYFRQYQFRRAEKASGDRLQAAGFDAWTQRVDRLSRAVAKHYFLPAACSL